MESAFSELCPSLDLFSLMMLSCQKEFPKDIRVLTWEERQYTLKYFNAPRSTIIDSTLTYPEMYDFYVISQELHVVCFVFVSLHL